MPHLYGAASPFLQWFEKLEFDGEIMAIAEGFYPKPATPSVSRCSFLSKADKMAADSSPNEGSQETRTAVTGLSGATNPPPWLLKKRGVVLACPFRLTPGGLRPGGVGGPRAVAGLAVLAR